jgi:uncharacterized protein (DUF2141 family)
MNKLALSWLALIGVAAMAAGDARADARVKLTVNAVDFRGAKGQALVALFDSKDAWPKLERAVRLEKIKPIKDGVVSVTWSDLPTGEYAVSVIHDENENGKLDMRWLPYPRPAEGAGASNDAPATVGPPSYSDARFRLSDKGGLLTIHMRYW